MNINDDILDKLKRVARDLRYGSKEANEFEVMLLQVVDKGKKLVQSTQYQESLRDYTLRIESLPDLQRISDDIQGLVEVLKKRVDERQQEIDSQEEEK